MFQPRPAFDDFKAQLEGLFGRSLAQPAEQAARDFWNRWGSFQLEISKRGLSVQVDALRLGLVHPRYKRYHIWKGGGLLLLIAGIALLWFLWPLGVALIAGGIAARVIGNWQRFNDAKQFAEDLMKNATLSDQAGGFANLCFNYIAGTIRLTTSRGVANWPQYPSDSLTGMQTRIPT